MTKHRSSFWTMTVSLSTFTFHGFAKFYLTGATVRLEQTHFIVARDVSEIVVCARVSFPDIDCPIVFPFEVKLTYSDRTAGK